MFYVSILGALVAATSGCANFAQFDQNVGAVRNSNTYGAAMDAVGVTGTVLNAVFTKQGVDATNRQTRKTTRALENINRSIQNNKTR